MSRANALENLQYALLLDGRLVADTPFVFDCRRDVERLVRLLGDLTGARASAVQRGWCVPHAPPFELSRVSAWLDEHGERMTARGHQIVLPDQDAPLPELVWPLEAWTTRQPELASAPTLQFAASLEQTSHPADLDGAEGSLMDIQALSHDLDQWKAARVWHMPQQSLRAELGWIDFADLDLLYGTPLPPDERERLQALADEQAIDEAITAYDKRMDEEIQRKKEAADQLDKAVAPSRRVQTVEEEQREHFHNRAMQHGEAEESPDVQPNDRERAERSAAEPPEKKWVSQLSAQDRRDKIRAFVQERRVPYLTHFTRLENLPSILERGILSRAALGDDGCVWNDAWRGDGHTHAICLSISHPNYAMFHSYKKDSEEKWAVLLLDPAILWELDCGFAEINAASSGVPERSESDLKLLTAVHAMFGQTALRSELHLESYYSTNPQAEVLVFEPISSSYIREICLRFEPNVVSYRDGLGRSISALERANLFKYRHDWAHWKKV